MRQTRLVSAVCLSLTMPACTSPPATEPASTVSPQASIQCDGEQRARLENVEDSNKIQKAYCREGFAFVRFGGAGVGVHGTQDIFYEWKDGAWHDIAWGETSHGAFIFESLDARENLDARRLATLFPEAGMTVPPAEPGFSVIIRADGIGDLVVGMTQQQARAAAPFPLADGSKKVGDCTILVTGDDGVPSLTVLLDAQGRVFAVSVTGGTQTADGIHISSTREELVSRYGSRLQATDSDHPYLAETSLKISFYMSGQIVSRIEAGRFSGDTAIGECAPD
jgi:hypothetical protein